MQIPLPPSIGQLQRISPTLYELLIRCRARASWAAFGSRDALPQHPAAILGTCFHAVAEAVQKGEIGAESEDVRAQARALFDQLARESHAAAHPLLRMKFRTPEKLPYYNLLRERAAALALEVAEQSDTPAGHDGIVEPRASLAVEQRFASTDGLLVGKPDLLNIHSAEVVDYKTGMRAAEPWRVSDTERRQLRLYAYLASEAGLAVTRGTIVRGDGQTASVAISRSEANEEAQLARREAAHYNDAVAAGATFSDLAQPSPENCEWCPCIPMCERFWQEARVGWSVRSGEHLEGVIRRIEKTVMNDSSLVSLEVEVSRGTVPTGNAVIEQVPATWTTADGSRPLAVGDVVRVVDGRHASEQDPAVVRVDRTMTALWRIAGRPPDAGSGRDEQADA